MKRTHRRLTGALLAVLSVLGPVCGYCAYKGGVTEKLGVAAGLLGRQDTSTRDAIEVYFGPASAANPRGISGAFLEFLASAEETIHGAFYDFSLMEAADVLIEKHRAGIEVALVSDSRYDDRDAIAACMAAGVPVVFDERSSYMHNKFCIVDGARVWTGSTNVTRNGMQRNDNNALIVVSAKLARNYLNEFQEMFETHRFGGGPRNTEFPEIAAGGVTIECYFAPEDRVKREIVSEIAAAVVSIDFMAFSYTSAEIAEAMADKARGGVRVRGLFERNMAGSKYSKDEYLAERGAEIHMDRNKYAMHHKVIVIDARTVIVGSYNFSKSAETRNDENVLIIHSPGIAEKYRKEFESLMPNGTVS